MYIVRLTWFRAEHENNQHPFCGNSINDKYKYFDVRVVLLLSFLHVDVCPV